MKATTRATLLLCGAMAGGCAATTEFDRSFVGAEIEKRAGESLPEAPVGAEPTLPPQVSMADGLTEAEAVAVALWNNADFHATLAEIGLARADLLQAGLLPNPVLSLVFPGYTPLYEGTLSLPIQLLQRRTRVAIAERDAERIANELVQTGLRLVRDVRVAHAELGVAEARAALRERESALLGDIATIAADQLAAGSISALEADRIAADALVAVAAYQDAVRQWTAARRRLAELLALSDLDAMKLAATAAAPPEPLPDLAALVSLALVSRPDLRAAELVVESAGESVRLERQQIYDFVALLDLQEVAGGDLETGGGLQIDLPIFDRNQAGRLRAEARIEQAVLRYTAVRRRVVLDVNASYADYRAALTAAKAWQDDVVPRLQASLEGTQRELTLGRTSELLVLRGEQRLLAARLAGAEALAELGRASANLAHSVGQKIAAQPQ